VGLSDGYGVRRTAGVSDVVGISAQGIRGTASVEGAEGAARVAAGLSDGYGVRRTAGVSDVVGISAGAMVGAWLRAPAGRRALREYSLSQLPTSTWRRAT